MRTLDVARINKDRHNWQRIDTFQTPYGNGQAFWENSQQRTRTSSRDRARAQSTQALAGLGLELEELRAEVRAGLMETKEDLSQTIAAAVNQIISELRQDVRTACQEACGREGPKPPTLVEPVAVPPVAEPESAQSPMPTALLSELCQQVLQACRSMCEEVEKNGRSSREELESLRDLCEMPHLISEMRSKMDQNHAELRQSLQEMDFSKLLDLTYDCRMQVASTSEALKASMEATRASAAEAAAEEAEARPQAQVPAFDPAAILEPMQQLVDSVDSRSARVLEEIRQVDPRRHFRECLAESGLADSVLDLREALLSTLGDIKGRLRELDPSGALREVKQSQNATDASLKALRDGLDSLGRDLDRDRTEHTERAERERRSLPAAPAAIDLSPILQALQEEHLSLKEAIRQHGDTSPVLSGLEQVRKSLATMSQEVEISREMVVKRSDVTSLSHMMQNAWDLMNQTNAFLSKVDFSYLQAEVQRVVEELREVRSTEFPKVLRQVQEMDFSPILRQFQDRKRLDEELSDGLREEMHKLRRDCDMGEIKQMLEQVDSSRMLRAIRECKVSSDDLAPVLEEVRRLAEEVRQARTNREAQQAQTALQDEVSSVKMELRSANRDVSQALSAIKDGQIGIDQVWKEFSVLKEALKQMSQQATISELPAAFHEAVEEIRSVRTAVASMTSTVLEAVDLAPMISEIQAVRSKVEVSSALKRQGDQMTKSDFAIALEELRGHFSLLLNSFREVCDQSNAGPSSRTCEQLLQSMRDQRKLVVAPEEPLSDLRQKLRDTQSVLGQAGTRHEEAMMRAKASARMSPDCQTEPIVTPWEPVAREPVAPGEPRTQEASAAKSSNFANVSFRG